MADVIPNGVVGVSDLLRVINNVPSSGTYIIDLSNVTVTFDNETERSPDDNGVVTIPQGAGNFTVYCDGDPIGALITFW